MDSATCDATGKCTGVPLVNGGWSYQSNIPMGAITMSGSKFGSDKFVLNNVHMHRISEHTIDGGHNPVELHFVFMNTLACPYYACNDQIAIGGNPSDCTAVGTYTCTMFCGGACTYGIDDKASLAILSIHFEETIEDTPNEFLQPIVDTVMANQASMKIENVGDVSTSDGGAFLTGTLDFNALLNAPEMQYYYSYEGGITIPPCVETVRWTVFRSVLKATGAQLQAFLGNFPDEDYRPTQPLNGRIVTSNDPQFAPLTNPDNNNNNDKNNNNNKVSVGGAIGIAIGCAAFGVIITLAASWIKNRKYRSIHSDKGSNEQTINP